MVNQKKGNALIKREFLGRCKHIKKNGGRCKAIANRTTGLCSIHSGYKPRLETVSADELVKSPVYVSKYLASLMIDTRKGKIEPNKANAITNIADKLLKIHDMQEEKKYRELMISIAERKSLPGTVSNPDLGCLEDD